MASQDWKQATNAEYQKVISSVTALATGSLVLPILFLRELLAVEEGKNLLPHLTWAAYMSAALLVFAVFFGVLFQYVSAKWIKNALGGETCLSDSHLEQVLDWSFWLSILSFLGGLVFLACFVVTAKAANF